ncbi:hypothetical protein KQ51_01572 [Candidatus Izimaplasma bacterium HR1]|jgi:hypothetical protein|uniref:immunoglobulin-like domain-containing protein n=1 Tax=Candidatus Izimoplasma sp. HR1 TaxID=1541959 RepID=UPI0004F8D3AF|nr:hypothetical protein KQ51_01572 [Candidatus Izimaplasma bacterium HR1]
MKKLLLSILLILTLAACDSTVEYTMTLNAGNDIISENETWVDSGCSITINEEDFQMELSGAFDNTLIGDQTLTYNYTYKDTTYVCKRVVKVLEAPNFNIELKPGLDTVKLNSFHIDKGLVFNDSNELDFIVSVTSNVNTSFRGIYTINYTIIDMDGNQLIISRVVNVIS